MSHRTLIAYASRAGSTAEVAEVIGSVLRERGIEADVRPVKEVADLGGYHSLVLGSAIWAGKPLPEMLRFAADHRDDLSGMPAADFILCDTLREDTPANRQVALGYVAPLRKIHEPISVGTFAGCRDFSKVHPLISWVLRHVFGLVEGDFRDWERIRGWAATVADQVVKADRQHVEIGATSTKDHAALPLP